jgi:hypothetical protein
MRTSSPTTPSRHLWLIFGLLAACSSGLPLDEDGGKAALNATGGRQPSTTGSHSGGAGDEGTSGTISTGGLPSGGIPNSETDGSAGAPGNAGTGGTDVNIRACPNVLDPSVVFPCYTCDPLPAGRTDGCPPASTFCSNDFDPNVHVRYPAGCNVKYGEYYVPYYPNDLESANCTGSVWQCLM